MQKWLARFAFSFIIIAVVLAYETYRASTGRLGPIEPWRVWVYGVGAILSFLVGLTGIRERHRGE